MRNRQKTLQELVQVATHFPILINFIVNHWEEGVAGTPQPEVNSLVSIEHHRQFLFRTANCVAFFKELCPFYHPPIHWLIYNGRLFRFCGPFLPAATMALTDNDRIQMTQEIPPYQTI